MFVRLLGKFVCGEMIAFAVCGGGGVVGVGGKILQLCNSIVGTSGARLFSCMAGCLFSPTAFCRMKFFCCAG